ncbi:MAG: hypothetical protein KAJ88_01400 [Candidatus Aenigmarchaeota archaeon]|nr:hypothetical protein [Candidatus Aenigmarchaeota archaeon]
MGFMVFFSSHRSNVSRRKGQLNIDYLFAFFILAFSIIYAANLALDAIGPFYSSADRNNLHAEAWIFSERFMRLVETEDHDINETLIYSYVENKTMLRDSIDEDFRYRQKINIDQYPVVLTTYVDGYNHTGSAVFNKISNPVLVNITVRNLTSSTYENIGAEADFIYSNLDEGDMLNISGLEYKISKIDPEGNFVIFERTVFSYGWDTADKNMITVNRYSVFDGFAARIKVMYF